MNEVLTSLLHIVRSHTDSSQQQSLLTRIPFLNKPSQWLSLLQKNNLNPVLCCEYIALPHPRLHLLSLLHELDQLCSSDEKTHNTVLSWCKEHATTYREWILLKKHSHPTPTFAFEERFAQKQKEACARLRSAFAWNVPYAKQISPNGLFPPHLLVIMDKKRPFVSVEPQCLLQVQHEGDAFLRCELYLSHTAQKPTKRFDIPTYVLSLWHMFGARSREAPWTDPMVHLLSVDEHQALPQPKNNEPIELDYRKECGEWFSSMIDAMVTKNPSVLRMKGNEKAKEFCRQHFHVKRVVYEKEKEKEKEKQSDVVHVIQPNHPWIADQGYWFQWSTNAIVQWMHIATFGLAVPAEYKRQCISDKWSRNDSDRVAFTTALFGIRAREKNLCTKDSCKSVDKYFALASKLFDWHVDLYIYVEPAHVERVYAERAKRGLAHRTFIQPTYMEQSRFWPCMKRIRECYSQERIPHGFCREKDTGFYVFSQATKYDCLQRSLTTNIFQSLSFYWVDFGIHHVVAPPTSYETLLQQLGRTQRLRVTYLRGLQPKEIENRQQFFSRLQQAVAGGLIGGPAKEVQWLIREFEREFIGALEWYPVLDEAVLAAVALTFPDRFQPIYSGHVEMFQLRSPGNCFRVMKACMDQKDWKGAYDIALEFPFVMNLDLDSQTRRIAMVKEVCQKLYKETGDNHYKDELRMMEIK